MRSPGEDGYRTPTIEDAERALSILGAVPESPVNQVREAHSSALEAALQRASSRATVKSEKPSKDNACREHNGLGLFGLKRTVSGELSWKKRLRHVTWAYFTLTMATGGLANVLYQGWWFYGLFWCGVLLTRNSPIPIQRSGYHWNRRFLNKYRCIPRHLGPSTCSILLLPLHIQSVFYASNRITIRARITSLFRDNPNQHIAVWASKHRPMAIARVLHFVLDRRRSRCDVFRGNLPPLMVNTDVYYRTNDSYLDLSCLPDAYHRSACGNSEWKA